MKAKQDTEAAIKAAGAILKADPKAGFAYVRDAVAKDGFTINKALYGRAKKFAATGEVTKTKYNTSSPTTSPTTTTTAATPCTVTPGMSIAARLEALEAAMFVNAELHSRVAALEAKVG